MLIKTIIFMVIKLGIAWIIFDKCLSKHETSSDKKMFKPTWIALYIFAVVTMVSGYVDMLSALRQIADWIFYRFMM